MSAATPNGAPGKVSRDEAQAPFRAEQATPSVVDQETQRLRWQCRRGMLELDLLLNRFLDSAFGDLGAQQRVDFVRLLGYQDQILYDWFLGHAVPAEPALRDLVAEIRSTMRP